MRYLGIETLNIAPAKLSRIIELVDAGEITRAAGKKVLSAVFENDVDVVVSGQNRLGDGMSVKLAGEKAPATSQDANK